MKIRMLFGFTLIFGCALIASANPPFFSHSPGPLSFTLVALVAETLIVAKFLGKHGFRYSKVFWAWSGITLATCGAMNMAIYIGGFDAFYVFYGDIFPSITFLLVLEALVVLAEAGIIMLMSKIKCFRSSDTPFRWRSALIISFLANLVSFGIGLLALFAMPPKT